MFARVLLTQRVDGLHHYNLEEKWGQVKKDSVSTGMKKKRLKCVNFVLVPSLETMVLILVIQQMQFHEVQS